MPSRYNLARARGGKDDAPIEEALKDKRDALRRQDKITTIVESLRRSHWEGQDRVDIQADHAVFLDRNDNTFSPVAIKAAVRVLHKHGFRGLFWIKVSGDKFCIQPLAMCKRGTVLISSLSRESSSGWVSNVESLWSSVLANPVSLFRTTVDDPLLAVFDEKGFFLSQQAQRVYDRVKDLPYIHVARLESENAYYFGISNQHGGRWKRSHAYHLGGLAYEILGIKRYDDQDHSNWIRAWFEPFEDKCSGSHYAIRMKEKVMISFFVPQPQASKAELEKAESYLIDEGRRRGLIVLNKTG